MWTVRRKVLVGVWLVLTTVGISTAGSLWALWSYRAVINDLDRNLNRVPQKRELLAALSGLFEPLQSPFPEEADGRFERQVLFLQRLTAVEQSTGETWRKLSALPELPDTAPARELAKDRLWYLDRGLQDLRQVQRGLTHPQIAQDTVAKLLLDIVALQNLAGSMPDFGTGLTELLHSSRQDYKAGFWWVTGATLLIIVLFAAGTLAWQRWIARPWNVLREGTSRIAQGNFDYRVRLKTRDEFEDLADDFNRMTDRFVEHRDQLHRRAHELAEQLARQERLAGLGFFAAGIAHEINNPLTAVRWTSESLLNRFEALFGSLASRDAALVKNYLQMIQGESTRCQEITARLLDFARGGEGQRVPHDAVQIIREVVQLVRAMSKYRHCDIEFARSEPCVVEINANEIKQVVINLMVNALDAIADAETTAAGRLEIRLGEFTDHVELEFQDSGCGMSAETLGKIFDPFFTTKPAGQGTGLGLPICHRIVTEHGGQLHAASQGPGRGSTIRVSLPRVAARLESAA